MTKRRAAGRTTPHADTLPEQAAVERAIEAVLDRLRPKDRQETKNRQDTKNRQGVRERPQPKSAGPATSRRPATEAPRKPGPDRKAD
ncbi:MULTISPECIES: hypothetical protein [unclassified Methylobacterium]|uniref:hypothetical protein n=1 Tax=unclassified Methylobacterium TaxID=2615210 RepID=UPI0011C1EA0C|nr:MULTISPECIES: hypothetical protein [unclassified Methylobacterium]QEE38915.1 hypothetical protein FVA80_08065 [Methylobacterium sp. WL1]TXN54851.1 hypothetical protein FV241_22455 [Methylobacterium sp. WL2]